MPPLPTDTAPLDARVWQQALDGDRDAFEAAVAPFHDDLHAAAERQIEMQRETGALAEEALNPTELVGETLVRAFEHRARFDADRMGFRAWLLGVQHRALARVMRQEDRYTRRKTISLGDTVPASEADDAVGEALYEFRQPFEVVTYADLVAGSQPIDVDFDPRGHEPLTDTERGVIAKAELAPEARQAILLHDEFDLAIAEVAQILDASLRDTAESLNLARASIRQRYGSSDRPSDPADATDSYTGDPVP
ncbi:MAG: hypothetical protein AAFQ43_08945 [Bacteroidota bacterium]